MLLSASIYKSFNGQEFGRWVRLPIRAMGEKVTVENENGVNFATKNGVSNDNDYSDRGTVGVFEVHRARLQFSVSSSTCPRHGQIQFFHSIFVRLLGLLAPPTFCAHQVQQPGLFSDLAYLCHSTSCLFSSFSRLSRLFSNVMCVCVFCRCLLPLAFYLR